MGTPMTTLNASEPLSVLSPQEIALLSTILERGYGANLLGTFFSLIPYGVSLHQFYRYIRLFPRDAPFIKTLVITVMLLETVQVAMLMYTCYWALVTNYADPGIITQDVWSVMFSPIVSASITITAQIFFARRVTLLGFKYKIITAVAGICLAGYLGTAIALTVVTFKLDDLASIGSSTQWLFPAGPWLATAADVLLGGALVAGLRRSRKNYGAPAGETRKDRFVLYVINTGLLTGTFNAIPSILAATEPESFRWAAIVYVANRLYANTLLSVLNSRSQMNSNGVVIFGTATYNRNIIARANHLAAVEQWNAPQLPDKEPTVISIKVTAESQADSPGADSLHEFAKSDYGM